MKNYASIRANRAKKASRAATPRQRKERARRKAMGIALIERPLRLIGAMTNTVIIKDGKPHTQESFEFQQARSMASRGYGRGVRSMAHLVLEQRF